MAVTLIQFRRGTAAEWDAQNPVLGAGEPGVAIDTGTLKVGDGTSPWSALPSSSDADIAQAVTDAQDAAAQAVAAAADAAAGINSVITKAGATGGQVAVYSSTSGRYEPTDFVGGGGGGAVTYDTLPAGTMIVVRKSGSTWPDRPTLSTNVPVMWLGAEPSPAIVTSGVGGMRDGIDMRMITA